MQRNVIFSVNAFIHYSTSATTKFLFVLLCLERLNGFLHRRQSWASEVLRVFPLLCCALPLVVLAISSLVAVPMTSWKALVIGARLKSPWQAPYMSVFGFVEHLDFSLGHLAVEHFCDIADTLYSLSIHHWLF